MKIGKMTRLFTLIAAFVLTAIVPVRSVDSIMPVSEIKPGMKGVGKSVFRGTEIEQFDVEVIDVLPNTMPKQDLILVKVSGHPAIDEAGVIAGMSGSPIYIDGRLIGALSYAWGFSKKAIAGVTPIEKMFEDMERPGAGSSIVARSAPAGKGELVPIGAPLVVSGMTPGVFAELTEVLASYNLRPMQGGGSRLDGIPVKLAPGSGVGVTITRGDISMDAIGTVTTVVGDRVLAFGHPFLSGGDVELPMTGAYIHTVLPSLEISTKMGTGLAEVGAMVRDRQSGIFGKLGKTVKMIPVEVNVINKATGHKETFKVEVGWASGFTPKILDIVLKTALAYSEPSLGENTVSTSMTVAFVGHKTFTVSNTFYNNAGTYNKAILEPVQRLILNPFEDVRIESVKIDATVDRSIRLATIKRMWLEEENARPGDTVHMHVVVQPFEGGEIDFPVTIEVPEDMNPGDKFLVGAVGGKDIIPPFAPPADFEEFSSQLASLYKTTDLVIIQQMPTVGAVSEGFMMEDLPPKALRIIGQGNSTGATLRQDLDFTVKPTDWVLAGKARLTIFIK